MYMSIYRPVYELKFLQSLIKSVIDCTVSRMVNIVKGCLSILSGLASKNVFLLSAISLFFV